MANPPGSEPVMRVGVMAVIESGSLPRVEERRYLPWRLAAGLPLESLAGLPGNPKPTPMGPAPRPFLDSRQKHAG